MDFKEHKVLHLFIVKCLTGIDAYISLTTFTPQHDQKFVVRYLPLVIIENWLITNALLTNQIECFLSR